MKITIRTMNKSLIEKLGLTEDQVFRIVLEWYTNGRVPYIFQNENGTDLEEYCEQFLYNR